MNRSKIARIILVALAAVILLGGLGAFLSRNNEPAPTPEYVLPVTTAAPVRDFVAEVVGVYLLRLPESYAKTWTYEVRVNGRHYEWESFTNLNLNEGDYVNIHLGIFGGVYYRGKVTE